ncbi:uncharacterized protein LOC120587867 isoform X2 [Pteropus medius]|uniref:uncharacterized protein LOC120587867 isoform X2 n=2 Tax=Pteropus vampyrus TaxID=132908 RepID=UPI00196A5E5E|nr:uncharacterized protein LOC120587867 isoform X2 [Pteropus giganteus]
MAETDSKGRAEKAVAKRGGWAPLLKFRMRWIDFQMNPCEDCTLAVAHNSVTSYEPVYSWILPLSGDANSHNCVESPEAYLCCGGHSPLADSRIPKGHEGQRVVLLLLPKDRCRGSRQDICQASRSGLNAMTHLKLETLAFSSPGAMYAMVSSMLGTWSRGQDALIPTGTSAGPAFSVSSKGKDSEVPGASLQLPSYCSLDSHWEEPHLSREYLPSGSKRT